MYNFTEMLRFIYHERLIMYYTNKVYMWHVIENIIEMYIDYGYNGVVEETSSSNRGTRWKLDTDNKAKGDICIY